MDYNDQNNAITPAEGDAEFFAAYGGKHFILLRNGERIPFTPPTLSGAADVLDLCDHIDAQDKDPEQARQSYNELLRTFPTAFGIADDVPIYPLEALVIVRRFFAFSRLRLPRPLAGGPSPAAAPAPPADETPSAPTASPTPSPTSPAPTTSKRLRPGPGRASRSTSGASPGSGPRNGS